MAVAFITKSLTFTKRAVHVTFDPRTYTQIHAPTMVQGGVNGALPDILYVSVFRNDFIFSGKPLIFLMVPDEFFTVYK